MPLSHSIKYKAEQIIKRIEKNDFDNSDIDTLLILLRDSSTGFCRFIEMAHFIAHPERIKGLLFDKTKSYYLTTKFMAHSLANRGNIDLTGYTPSFMKDYILDKLDRSNDNFLRKDLKYNRKDLKSDIDNYFKDYHSLTRLEINDTDPKFEKFDIAIRSLLGMVDFTAVFDVQELVNDFIGVFKLNNLFFDEKKFRLQTEKIILSMLLLLHNAILKTNYGSVEMIVSGGAAKTLIVGCKIPMYAKSKHFHILLPILDSGLQPSKWCKPSFFRDTEKKSIFELNENFKLERILIIEREQLKYDDTVQSNIRLINITPSFVLS